MAISPYPSPAEAGVLCVILANTAISISIFKGFVRCFLHIIGIHFASWDEFSGESSESAIYRKSPSESYMEDFRTRTPAVRYGSVFRRGCPREECSICLADFKPNSDVNRLSCGHVFHCSCLEKWLKYWNTTCPLCRNYMMPDGVEEEDDCTPM